MSGALYGWPGVGVASCNSTDGLPRCSMSHHRYRVLVKLLLQAARVQDDRRYRAWLSNLNSTIAWNLRPRPPFIKGMNGLRYTYAGPALLARCAGCAATGRLEHAWPSDCSVHDAAFPSLQ